MKDEQPRTAVQPESAKSTGRQRTRQTDVPGATLKEALRIAEAIALNFGKHPSRPIDVAEALNMSPTSGRFRTLCGAAIGYGLTTGGSNSKMIALSPLGTRIVNPLEEGDDEKAKREAVMKPTVEQQFLERYDGSPLPASKFATNVLETLGVPTNTSSRVYEIIRSNAQSVGFIKTIKDKQYVDIGSGADSRPEQQSEGDVSTNTMAAPPLPDTELDAPPAESTPSPKIAANRRVFVSTGAEKVIAEQLEQILRFGGLEPVLAQHQSPISVAEFLGTIDEMKSCSSAVIHAERFGVERPAGIDHLQVELQISLKLGSALALFGDRFVVLAERGVRLPKELADLHVVNYSSDGLDINDMVTIAKALEPERSAN